MKLVESIKSQDRKQKILLTVFTAVLAITVLNVYFSFFAKPDSVSFESGSGLAPLKVNIKILDSEAFDALKNN